MSLVNYWWKYHTHLKEGSYAARNIPEPRPPKEKQGVPLLCWFRSHNPTSVCARQTSIAKTWHWSILLFMLFDDILLNSTMCNNIQIYRTQIFASTSNRYLLTRAAVLWLLCILAFHCSSCNKAFYELIANEITWMHWYHKTYLTECPGLLL